MCGWVQYVWVRDNVTHVHSIPRPTDALIGLATYNSTWSQFKQPPHKPVWGLRLQVNFRVLAEKNMSNPGLASLCGVRFSCIKLSTTRGEALRRSAARNCICCRKAVHKLRKTAAKSPQRQLKSFQHRLRLPTCTLTTKPAPCASSKSSKMARASRSGRPSPATVIAYLCLIACSSAVSTHARALDAPAR